jgi:hypothetical protein
VWTAGGSHGILRFRYSLSFLFSRDLGFLDIILISFSYGILGFWIRLNTYSSCRNPNLLWFASRRLPQSSGPPQRSKSQSGARQRHLAE